MTRDSAAEEFTAALDQTASGLGQASVGWWRQVAVGVRLKMPQALGISREEWTEARRKAFGDVLLSMPERKEAVKVLTASVDDGGEGLSNRQAADVLGVTETTIRNDKAKVRNNFAESDDNGAEVRDNFAPQEPEPRAPAVRGLISGHLAKAAVQLDRALTLARDADEPMHAIESLIVDVAHVRAALNLLVTALGGDSGIDWDSELANLDGE